jgi:hypothetical protein
MNNEPVAWINKYGDEGWLNWDEVKGEGWTATPLYLHPDEHDLGIAEAIGFDKGYAAAQAKTLTDEEIDEIAEKHTTYDGWDEVYDVDVIGFARAIMDKAQEK